MHKRLWVLVKHTLPLSLLPNISTQMSPGNFTKCRFRFRLPEACVSSKLPGAADPKSSRPLTTAVLDRDYLRSDLITDIHFQKSRDVEM